MTSCDLLAEEYHRLCTDGWLLIMNYAIDSPEVLSNTLGHLLPKREQLAGAAAQNPLTTVIVFLENVLAAAQNGCNGEIAAPATTTSTATQRPLVRLKSLLDGI
jgi:phage repressor protein C with HTH and peptisase S24 domain